MPATRLLQDLQYRLEYGGLKLALVFFRLLGVDRASNFGGWAFRKVGPKLPISRIARTNLARAIPEMTASEIEDNVAKIWENLGRTAAEYAHIDKIAGPERDRRISVVGIDRIQSLVDKNQPIIFISGHMANWELLPLSVQETSLAVRAGEVYRHANNPYVNDWMIRLRAKYIIPNQIPKGGPGGRQLVSLLKQKRSICMLVDQKMNNGVEARFFGVPAMTTPSTAVLALRFRAPIVLVTMERTHGAHFKIEVHPPMKIEAENNIKTETARLTQAVNDALEAHIRKRPHEWFWLHNRWPKGAVRDALSSSDG